MTIAENLLIVCTDCRVFALNDYDRNSINRPYDSLMIRSDPAQPIILLSQASSLVIRSDPVQPIILLPQALLTGDFP